jgi:NADH-quinone oxidoreductase subunit F
VPPADAWGVVTFYALLATTPRPRRVLHVCDDIACRNRGARAVIDRLAAQAGPAHHPADGAAHVSLGDGDATWMTSPCLGLCDHAPAALLTAAGEAPLERLVGHVTGDAAAAWLESTAASRHRQPLLRRPSPQLPPASVRGPTDWTPMRVRGYQLCGARPRPRGRHRGCSIRS